MPAIEQNSLTLALPKLGIVLGAVTGTGTIFTGISGVNTVAASQISVAKNSTGNYTVTVRDFKGPQGVAYGFGNALVAGNIVSAPVCTYSGNTLSAIFLVTDAAAVAADDTINIQIVAA